MRSLIFVVFSLSLTSIASAVPMTMSHQGRLLDGAGVPINGTFPVTVKLYIDSGTTAALWTEPHPSVPFEDGYFSLELGSIVDFDTDDLDGSTRYLGFSVDNGTELTPRTSLVSVPYALRAAVADNASNMSLFDGITRQCANGATQTFNGTLGEWSACPSTWNCTDTPTHPGCASAPASSDFATCLAIRDAPGFDGTDDGLYWIDPDGANAGDEPFQAYCVMSYAGGGWTLVMNIDTSDGHYVHFNNTEFWTSTSGYGNLNTRLTADYKPAVAYRDVSGDAFLAVAHTEAVNIAWRVWGMPTPRTMQQITNSPTNTVFTSGTTSSFNTSSLNQYEAVVRPGGELEANARYGATTSYDESRILNSGAAGLSSSTDGDNTVIGIGTWMDVNNGTKGSRWDAGYGWNSLSYNTALMGSDENLPDPWPTTNSLGLNYDYAMFIR